MKKLIHKNIDSNHTEEVLTSDLGGNEKAIKRIFSNCADLIIRRLVMFDSTPAFLVYLRFLVNDSKLEDKLLQNLMSRNESHSDNGISNIERLEKEWIAFGTVTAVDSLNDAVQRIVQGEAVLFIEGEKKAVSVAIPIQVHRALEPPNIEASILGPQISFIENLDINLGLVRSFLHTPRLKIEFLTLGKVTKTQIAITYLEGKASEDVLQELRKRLSSIEMDSITAVGYVVESIQDTPHTPFPLVHRSQRPDTVAASLIEGKVAVFVHGNPMTLILPITFWYGFSTPEDYYMNYIFATQLRWLRFLFAFTAMALPSLYVAVVTFHPEMIPTSLALTIAASREIIPFPTMVETLIMEISFEALREAGIRLPRSLGPTISIVGALVIGQAAVQAGIISAPIVMIVSLTGIASFVIPHPTMTQAVSFLRFPMVIFAGMFGLYGIGLFMIAIIIHLVNLRSFGVYYMWPLAPFNGQGLLDLFVRAPWKFLQKRQQSINQGMGAHISDSNPDQRS